MPSSRASDAPAPRRAPPGGWRQAWARRDSLLTRLLLAQGVALLAMAVVLGVLFYAERNVAIARLYASHWAAPVLQALRAPRATGQSLQLAGVSVQDNEPQPSLQPLQLAPRFTALRQTLAGQGLTVVDLRLQLRAHPARLWLRLHEAPAPASTAVWVGLDALPLLPEWSGRIGLALLLALACLVALSWSWARWLSRPLEALRVQVAGPEAGAASSADPAALRHAVPEIRAIAAAHAALQERLVQQARERAVLLAGVSHDLRSPLGRIRLAAELLPDEPALQPRKAAIARNVAQADQLVESFLDHVRAGELPLDQTVDLAAVARQVAAGFERPADELTVDAPASLPWPRAHPLLVARLIGNLVGNAVAHGRAPVRLSVQPLPDGGVRLAVSDAGEGIAPDQVALLQEAFVRGDRARGRPGSGLGLAIVRQVTQRLGGQLAFEPLTPQGLCVSVTLPRPDTP